MIQQENRWMDLGGIWYGCYAIGDYLKIILQNFLQLLIPTWQADSFSTRSVFSKLKEKMEENKIVLSACSMKDTENS
jgi:hypothetical protein